MYKKWVKRALDICISAVALPFILLIIAIFGLTIKLCDRGPVFYNAGRVGKNGKIFKMYKLRSMKVGAPDIRNPDGSTYSSENDPRLTKIGKFIRKTSIDELPQIFNILKGDMSLIGPRPELPDEAVYYTGDEHRKLEVPPGITGYSQAYYRNSINLHDKIKNDIYYIDNLTFVFDLKIIGKTIRSIVSSSDVFTAEDIYDPASTPESAVAGKTTDSP